MNRSIDSVLNELEKQYTVTEVDPGKYKEMKMFGVMKFKVQQYAIEELGNLSDEAKAEKQAITLAYTDGLIEKGGISTDVFKKELGAEETKNFFDQVFFGTLRN